MSKDYGDQAVCIRPMALRDLGRVVAIDRESFPTPWPREAFLYEIQPQRNSLCWVAEIDSKTAGKKIIGSIVIWINGDQAHIGTLAVAQRYRQRGIGQYLLAEALLACEGRGVTTVSLEVRETNTKALRLYQKFGFEKVGLREDYYQDTHENALVLTLTTLDKNKLAALANKR